MIGPRYAELAGKALAHQGDAPPLPPAPNDRARAIGAIEAALAMKARRKRQLRWGMGAASVAAAVAMVVTAGMLASRDASLETARSVYPSMSAGMGTPASPVLVGQGGDVVVITGAGLTSAPSEGTSLARGSHLVARRGGHAILAFATGTRLSVDEGGDLAVVDDGQIFALRAGSMRADVVKLASDERFVVRTPDAEVEARGASFRIAIAPATSACGDGAVTRVTVFEGVVVVKRGTTQAEIGGGEDWPRGCVAGLAASPISADLGAAKPSVAAPRPSESDVASSGGSSLAKQNDLFAQAVAQKSSGRPAAAVATFERLLATYPTTPLAEAAFAERMKLLATIDRGRATSAAKQYLARYPGGFARADAEAIAAGSR